MAKVKVIDVFATWCGPCRFYAPTFQKVSEREDMQDVEFVKIDADENEDLCAKFNIRNIPTTLILNAETDALINRLMGVQSEDALVGAINSARGTEV